MYGIVEIELKQYNGKAMISLSTKSKKGMIIDVQPLRTADEIEEFREAIQVASSKPYVKRNLLLFNIGINTGLRIGDIITLRIEDVKGRTSLAISEGKTDKKRIINLAHLMAEISDYIESIGEPTEGWLFPSRKGDNHISTTQAYRILTTAAESIGRDDIGTHTLRKTFGYHYYRQYNDLVMLSDIFNHSSQAITRRYIGIRADEINNSLREFKL
ncbi:tyrosine-type recombinase/integrase [Oceanobacillus sp. MO10714A]|uniref:tyrosine-type recombinase/integrase n=1 Tax=Oceanobacillus sp. MO10714A TaxID=3098290 RepID=UPI003FA57E46